MEDLKWARKINNPLVEKVLSFNPKRVRFTQNIVNGVTWCDIKLENDSYKWYWGAAICSVLDRFDPIKGKTIALGRALAALENKRNNRKVRSRWSEFPNSWSKRQIERVIHSGVWYKSYIDF
jgi:hypothetical protein